MWDTIMSQVDSDIEDTYNAGEVDGIGPDKLKILVLNLPRKKFNLAFGSFCKIFLVFREHII